MQRAGASLRVLVAPGFHIHNANANIGCPDEPDNGRRRSTTWYVEEYKEKEEEEEEEDGGGGGRDLSWDQSEVCNLFRWFSMM